MDRPWTIEDVGNIKFLCTDLNKRLTIKEYIKHQMITLWTEIDMFSGKRPFGNSGWDYEIYRILIKKKIISGTLRYNEIHEFNETEARNIILSLIRSL